jgi:hypothetical protein
MSPLTVESSEWVHPGVTSVPCRAGVEERSVRGPVPRHLLARASSTHAGAHIGDGPGHLREDCSAAESRSHSVLRPQFVRTHPFDRSSYCGWSKAAPMRALVAFPQESVRVISPHRQRPRPQLPAPGSADSEYSDAARETPSVPGPHGLSLVALQEFFEPHARRQYCVNRGAPDLTCVPSPHARLQFCGYLHRGFAQGGSSRRERKGGKL